MEVSRSHAQQITRSCGTEGRVSAHHPDLRRLLFLGMTYGVYMRTSGFSFWYPMIMSVVIFGGSLEFVARACCSRRLRRCRSS